MKVICDIETNRLENPSTIWVIVCKDTETGNTVTFKKPLEGKTRDEFIEYANKVNLWIGHNFIQFDGPVINRLFQSTIVNPEAILDTLVLSRLIEYGRDGGHSLESWGEKLGIQKLLDVDFREFNPAIVTRCQQDVEINYQVYLKLKRYTTSERWKDAIQVEHKVATLCGTLNTNGFYFNLTKAKELQDTINHLLLSLDKEILKVFKPKYQLKRLVEPKVTKDGKPYKNYTKWLEDENTKVRKDGTIEVYERVEFNLSSPKQIVTVLNEAGWKPTDKTKGFIEYEREAKRNRLDIDNDPKYIKYKQYGWKINEKNLSTLPEHAPKSARTLAKRILLESRRRTLEEWITLVGDDLRIHGTFDHIGSWTHRMAHRSPNTANIPRDDKEYGGEMRALWSAPTDRYLVGVDAEGIQLRVFAHYIDDKEFTKALIDGKKEEGTDPHSLTKSILGPICKSRDAAKTFIYALLLGASVTKLAEILECSKEECNEGLGRILQKYEGWKRLKEEQIPYDAKRGYFEGFDGRFVKILGNTPSDKRHLALSGYLQNGEAVVMKRALVIWYERLLKEKLPFWFVNFVHDEWQTETVRDYDTALYIANVQAEAIKIAGEQLNLKCPMAGSIIGGHKKIAIGNTWLETH